jgi:vacuolar protein sorting-associated protein 1
VRRKWKSTIRGEEHKLKHGYYCVRLLDEEERAAGISREEARDIEKEFFNTPEWSDTDQRRCGVRNLVADISGLLVDLIAKKYATNNLSFEFPLIKRY